MDDFQNISDVNDISTSPAVRQKPVLRDAAYRDFMDHLLSGHIRPGLLFSQRELCQTTGSTIGAMREALKRLEAEGIITLIPQRGVMVLEPSEDEINDIYETRKILEAHATRIYAKQGDLENIARIKQQTRVILERRAETRKEAAVLSRDSIVVDDLLHLTLLDILHNQSIDDFFEKLRVQVQVNRLGVQPRFMNNRSALQEHLIIIEALEMRDADAAAQAMVDHLEGGRRRAVGLD